MVRAGPRAVQADPAARARAGRRSLTTNLVRDVPKTKARRVLLRAVTSSGYSLLCEGCGVSVGERLVAGGYASGTPIAVSPSGFPGFAIAVIGVVNPGERGGDDARSVSYAGKGPAAVDDPCHRLTR